MDEETEAQGGMLWPEHCSGDGDRPGPLDFPGAVRGGASPSHPPGRRWENRNRNNGAACFGQGLLMSLHLLMWCSSLRMPLEKALSPCCRQGNCGPERLRHLPNITQEVYGREVFKPRSFFPPFFEYFFIFLVIYLFIIGHTLSACGSSQVRD